MTVRVLVADDQALLRAGLSGIVETAPDLTVVGEAGTGREAVNLASALAPDVVLMDIRMPELDGIEATRLITGSTDVKVLILTTFDLDEYVYAALRNGASGFVLKDSPARDLLDAIRTVAAGQALLAPAVTKRLIRQFTARPPAPPLPDAQRLRAVTEREREILTLIALGLSNGEIVEHLGIGPGTVKTHIRSLLHKLGARDRVQLVIIAYRSGLVGDGGGVHPSGHEM
ncbi:response regulator [Catenulispora pinisilvae]|uniref:response regulator n=1 Tax=Catenulispora pinisilvae TaxID=2705253 RepID=UPI0018922406|nr:response regulator transcription factor [Catenulispora pinisilvae]